jgi:PAS domain S-box-containing protein
MITKSQLISENEKLLKGIQTRQNELGTLSHYLSELESQLALIFAASPDIIVFLDENFNIVKISDAAYTILGYSKHELLHKSIWNFILKDDVEDTKQRFADLAEKKVLYFDGKRAFISHWISKDGTPIKLVWRFSLCDERENRTIGVASDISQFSSNSIYNIKLLQKTVDSSTDGIFILDAQDSNKSIIYANRAYEKITGYSYDELIGNNCKMLHTEDTKQSRVLKNLYQCLDEGRNCDVLLQYKRKNGEIFYNRLAISTVVEFGIVVNFIGVSRDITNKIGIRYDWSPNAESGFIHLTNPTI